jgi:ABC-type cobalamin/Fe3+-siderophores transport system ATPase subunit
MTTGPDPGVDPAALQARSLRVAYDGHTVLRNIDCTFRAGELTAIIGPNGSGKTTLLHALSGIGPLASGEVDLHGRPLRRMSRREIARGLTLVPQFTDVTIEITVEEAVSLGRYPWVGPARPLGAKDRAAIDSAIALLDLTALRHRPLATLSGGERQRVLLARSWAQDAGVFLLDEPVASLDLRFQRDIYLHLRRLAHEERRAVLVADHHVNLVACFCDRVLLLRDGVIVGTGSPRDALTAAAVHAVFGVHLKQVGDSPARPQFIWDA